MDIYDPEPESIKKADNSTFFDEKSDADTVDRERHKNKKLKRV